jgi:hypothetical protein
MPEILGQLQKTSPPHWSENPLIGGECSFHKERKIDFFRLRLCEMLLPPVMYNVRTKRRGRYHGEQVYHPGASDGDDWTSPDFDRTVEEIEGSRRWLENPLKRRLPNRLGSLMVSGWFGSDASSLYSKFWFIFWSSYDKMSRRWKQISLLFLETKSCAKLYDAFLSHLDRRKWVQKRFRPIERFLPMWNRM